MQVSVEVLSGLERRVYVEMPYDLIDKKAKDKVQEIAKTARIDGFRPGKVPTSLIEKRYGQAIRQDLLNDLVREKIVEAVAQEKLRVAGFPRLEVKQFEVGKPITFEATCEIYPTIDVVDIAQETVTRFTASVADSDLDDELEMMRKQRTTWKEVDRASQKEDKVIIEYTCIVDEKPAEKEPAKNFEVILGSHTMIPGFEEGLEGRKVLDTFTLELTFPNPYTRADYSGKKGVFTIKIQKVLEPILPELNDEFAKHFGIEEGGLAALKEKIRKDIERQLKRTLLYKNKKAIIDLWLKHNKFDVPKTLVQREIDYMRDNLFKQVGITTKDKAEVSNFPDSLFAEEAQYKVTCGLLLNAAIEKYAIKADEKRVRELIEDLASEHKNPQVVIDWYYADHKRLAQYEMLALENQVIDKLLEQAKITEKKVSYKELMAQ